MKFATHWFVYLSHQHPEEGEQCDRAKHVCKAVCAVRPFETTRGMKKISEI
jgi:hypothetical protein